MLMHVCACMKNATDSTQRFILSVAKISGYISKVGYTGQPAAASQASANVQQPAKPRTPEEWIEALVQQMAGAKDMSDARQRAGTFLQSFEQTVLQTATKQVSRSYYNRRIQKHRFAGCTILFRSTRHALLKLPAYFAFSVHCMQDAKSPCLLVMCWCMQPGLQCPQQVSALDLACTRHTRRICDMPARSS